MGVSMEAETLRRLLELLNAEPQGPTSDPFVALVRQAKEDALVEAQARLRELFVQAILQAVFGGCPLAASEAVHAEGAAPSGEDMAPDETTTIPRPEAPSRLEPVDNRQQLISEMEAIRRQIAENEERLQRVKTAPPDRAAPPSEAAMAAAEPVADAADGDAADDVGYYVYGVLPAAQLPDDAWPTSGMDPAYPVEALSHGDILAAVSQVPLGEYGEQGLAAHLEDLQWVEEKVRCHQEVLGALMQHGPVIPLRFGVIYLDAERVREMLAEGYERWERLLAELRGKQEWGLKLYVSRETLIHKVGEVSPRVQQLKTEIARQSSGAAYMARKKLDAIIAEEMERLCDEYAQESHDRLASRAVRACTNPLQSREVTGRDEQMLLNGAYLVREEQWPAFRAEVAALEEQYGPLGLIYALTGPWPPYSFVDDSPEKGADDSGHS
jgi:hypothetical protein